MVVILKVLTGSRAYGLERPDSDHDYHAVHVESTSSMLRLDSNLKSHEWSESREVDCQSWELSHFLQLATRCNPTALEAFVAPVAEAPTSDGWELRALFPYVLSRQRVRDAFLGYARNQRIKLFAKPDNPTQVQPTDRTLKFATQYLRVLLVGERLLRHGTLVLNMNEYGAAGSTANFLRDVRSGRVTMGRVIDRATELEVRLKLAYETSTMCEEPDLDRVNEFLLKMRRNHWL